MDIYEEIVIKIIDAQEAIIGPVALEEAERVPGLDLNWDKHKVNIEGDGSTVVSHLVEVYQELFGQISREVSKQAVVPLLSQLPAAKLPRALA